MASYGLFMSNEALAWAFALACPAIIWVVLILNGRAKRQKESRSRQGAGGGSSGQGSAGPKRSTSSLRGAEQLSKSEREAAVKAFIERVTAGYEGRVYAEPSDVQWRGEVDGHPTMVRLKHFTLELDMKAGHQLGYLDLRHDPKKRYRKDKPAPWADGDSSDVFIGPGIYLYGDEDMVAAELARFEAIPAPARERLMKRLPEDDVGHFELKDDGRIRVTFRRHANELRKPEDKARRQLEVMAAVATALEGVTDPMQDEEEVQTREAAVPTQVLSCTYCESRFHFGPAVSECPNCGAPPPA